MMLQFIQNNYLVIIIIVAMLFMMRKGGGCCGGGHAHGNHGSQGNGGYGGNNHGNGHGSTLSFGGGCCGGGGYAGYSQQQDSDRERNDQQGKREVSIDSIGESKFATDPVCGMRVYKTDAITRQVNGKTYYFCSRHCADTFAGK